MSRNMRTATLIWKGNTTGVPVRDPESVINDALMAEPIDEEGICYTCAFSDVDEGYVFRIRRGREDIVALLRVAALRGDEDTRDFLGDLAEMVECLGPDDHILID